MDSARRDHRLCGWSALLCDCAGRPATLKTMNYHWALVPRGQPIEIGATKVEGQAAALAERVSRRLSSDGDLATQQAGAAIRHQLDEHAAPLWKSGHVSVADLWATYAQYPYMPRLCDRSVLEDGLLQQPMIWQQDGFAIADGYDEIEGRYRGLVLPDDEGVSIAVSGETLIVRPDLAVAQRAVDIGETQGDSEEGSATTGAGQGPDSEADGAEVGAGGSEKTRFFGSKRLSIERPALDFKKISDEILVPLESAEGADLKITIEIEATSPDGFDDWTIRTVAENAKTLKFDSGDFENE